MLSRRSTRVKVMQVLFAKNRDEALKLSETIDLYWRSVDNTFEMFLMNLYLLVQITRAAREDEASRKKKYLPTDKDKQFKAKLFNNPIITKLDGNRGLNAKFAKLKFEEIVDKDLTDKIYSYFSKEQMYIDYTDRETTIKDDIDILLELYRFCRQNEMFNELLMDHYYNWESEKSIIIGAIKKVLKEERPTENFYNDFYPEDITTRDFGEKLLIKTVEDEDKFNKLIIPNLKNWDKDRVTILDMLLIKMAIAEFMNFETIPAKVTLNEFVELSKNYSTEKSKEFVNGVLDKIFKELDATGKYNKFEEELPETGQ
ncbi:MAG TPA: transcription antitermination factor NusB [Saprospirales bacterium]|nr:transcription antitermination factor NusB [Saprospirales bacterium]HAY71469.1 transcription antitermination factor NusB [Saprospirales bacterium]HRQ29460.1 transcription antitermination factor NusB [Saprospiraceae bacterium]